MSDYLILQDELDVYSRSGDLGCQPCDCHVIGSASSKCDKATGQCPCKENVVGKRCDQCAENFAGMDKLGCKGEPVQLLFLCSLPLPLVRRV